MNKAHYILLVILIMAIFSSCSDWLDIKPENEERENDMFQMVSGYEEALSGCYTSLVSQNIYGKQLSMSEIECLACLWKEPVETNMAAQYRLYHHQYDNDDARDVIKAIYTGLFNVVAQANLILRHTQSADSSVINSRQKLNLIRGEAYAIRAFCQMDVLRLFGQMPKNAQKTVSLPYSEDASIDVLPSYYDFNSYITKLQTDLDRAEKYLRLSDPLAAYISGIGDDVPTYGDDDFLKYRNMRFNYWAVRAMKARLYQYIGETQKAHDIAMEIINAKDDDGNSFISLSGLTDLPSNYYALPNECILALSNDGQIDYSISVLGGDPTATFYPNQTMCITQSMLKDLFDGQNTSSNNRYQFVWEKETADATGIKYPTIKKYYYNAQTSYELAALLTYLEIIPLIRLSEIYLIAMETTTDLAEANSLYKTYMLSHNVMITDDIASLDDVKQIVLDEYRREFYGEGVMFYVYKRLGKTSMKWTTEAMSDEQYVLPLPDSEYDPNATKQ